MALTITKTFDETAGLSPAAIARGGKYLVKGKIAFDSSYPTDGEALAAADISANGSTIEHIEFSSSIDGAADYHWDATASKIKAHTAVPTLTLTKETGLSPATHVVTPVGTPFAVLRGQITTAAGGGATGALNLQDAAPASSLDGQVAADESTVTCLAADDATAVSLSFLTYAAGNTEYGSGADLSAAGKACYFTALVS